MNQSNGYDEMLENLNEEFLDVDPLRDAYREVTADRQVYYESLDARKSALMVIDVQYLDAAEGYGVFADATRSGVPPEAQEYYFTTLKQTVIPSIQKLLTVFRRYNLEVIHTRIQSLTRNGRDRGPGHKRLGLFAPPGSIEAEFLPEVAPQGDEIIMNKTSSGVFNSTNLFYILRNIGINALYVTGVYTNECVSTTVRDACDLGFHVTLIEDGCTTVTPTLQENTLTVLKDRYARVLPTDRAIDEIESFLRETRQTKENLE